MELKKRMTVAEAVAHFDQTYFRPADGKPMFTSKDKEYFQCYRLVQDAANGDVTYSRVRGILEAFAPGMYTFKESIETTVPDANGPAFKSGLEKIWAENEGDLDETKIEMI